MVASPAWSSRRSTSRASSKALPGASPVADIVCAISPFEYGSPWPRWTTMVSGISPQADQLGVEIPVEADRAVANEDDGRTFSTRVRNHGVDRRGLELGQVDVASLGGGP